MNTFPSVDKLIELAEADPQELEKVRQREIEALIQSAPPHLRKRLRGLQFQVDCRRKLHRTPLGACIAISSMMFDSLQELNSALHGTEQQREQTDSAKVVAFPSSHQKSLHLQ